MWFGPNPEVATTFLVGQMKWLFDKLDDVGKREAEANLHEVMAAHAGEDGVLLGSGVWIDQIRATPMMPRRRLAPRGNESAFAL